MRPYPIPAAFAALMLAACMPAADRASTQAPAAVAAQPATTPTKGATMTMGRITQYDPSFAQVVAPDARIEKLAEGLQWAEGPAWVADGGYLLFTDVPGNRIHRWSERDGASVFLEPSGYVGAESPTLREPGANGLFVEADGTLLLANSGGRSVQRLDLATKQRTTLAAQVGGKRFNSPNDLVRRSDGAVFFTDPPYGLEGIDASPAKQLAVNGVYRLDPDGSVHLLEDGLRFPNGIALSPDERTLYVSNSDEQRPIWMAYTLDDAGDVVDRRVFADASDLAAAGAPGLPDGLKVAADGRLFATGPGGVIVFDPDGKRLGRIETGGPIANCAFGDDGRTLYLTSQHILARVRVQVSGQRFPH